MFKYANTKLKDQLNLAVFGDVHLGNHRNPVDKMIAGLDAMFPDDAETAALDIIVIEGDLFDKLLYLNNPHLTEIDVWAVKLMRLCSKHDILLRVLEGTPSHDMKQSKRLQFLKDQFFPELNFKYVDTLSFEHIEKHNLDVIYLPDEWDSPLINCFTQAQKLLNDRNLKQCDIAIMHGAFDHQLPAHLGVPTHDGELWQTIVREYIFVGHIHQHSIRDKIVAAGSTDRHTHGDEAPKGHVRAKIAKSGNTIEFRENKHAMLFKSFEIENMSIDDALKHIEQYVVVNKPPAGSHFRIVGNKEDAVKSLRLFLTEKHRDYIWEDKLNKAKNTSDTPVLANDSLYEPIPVTPDNIVSLVESKLSSNGIDAPQSKRCLALLAQAHGVITH